MSNNDINASVKFKFPVGYHNFHKDRSINFQLNRFYSCGYAKFDDMVEAGRSIKTAEDWKDQFIMYAKRSEEDGKLINAAYYYRAAEFYIPPDTAEKHNLYQNFKQIIQSVMIKDGVEVIDVPYKGAFLPCLRIKSLKENIKGDIVVHGGFDSFKEEFYSAMKYFSSEGYDVIVFEGPGQGEALRKHKLAMNHHWEKPTSAVLDYFELKDVTLLGISFGGYLCFRAAAFDKRIKRLIASSIAYDYTDHPAKILQPIVYLFYNVFTKYTANEIVKLIEKGGFKSWYFSNLMYMLQTDNPTDAVKFLTAMTAKELHCENIKQDVLILTGRDDHLTPFKMHKKQVKALINAKTVTDRIFYKDSSASNHCQIGNMGLNFKMMVDWIEKH